MRKTLMMILTILLIMLIFLYIIIVKEKSKIIKIKIGKNLLIVQKNINEMSYEQIENL